MSKIKAFCGAFLLKTIPKAISVFFTLIVLTGFTLTIIPSSSDLERKNLDGGVSEAFVFCSYELGQGMDASDRWGGGSFLAPYPNASAKGRVWTIQELYATGSGYVGYQGENSKGQNGLIRTKGEVPELKGLKTSPSRLESARTISSCFTGGFANILFNTIYDRASLVSSFTSFVATSAFDQGLICKNDESDSPYCIDLVGLIGGKKDTADTGIIGALTSGIYFPLAFLVMALSVFYILYKAFWKNQMREAMKDMLYVIISFMLGLLVLLQPSLLASAPMKASNVVGSCVVGAVTGNNCLGGSTTPANESLVKVSGSNAVDTSSNVCFSSADNLGAGQLMSMNVNGLVCETWKSFVLNPMAQGNFGVPFNDLDVTNPHISEMISNAGLTNEDFCVGLKSNESASDTVLSGKPVVVNNTHKVCNLMAYQLALKTDVVQEDGVSLKESVKYDPRWYKLIDVIGQDEKMFNTWVAFPSNLYHRGSLASLSLVSAIMGGFVISVASVMSLAYYIMTILLMAFAPFFILLGIHPGRGRELFKGWLSQIIENFYYYVVSALFVSLSVVFYGAVLGAVQGLATGFVMVLVTSVALFVYRREFLELIGRVRMSGERFSSGLSNTLTNQGKKVSDIGTTAVAGAIGSKLAGGETWDGTVEAVRRKMARQDGFVGDTFKQINRQDVNSRNNARSIAKDAGKELDVARQAAELARTSLEVADSALLRLQRELSEKEQALVNAMSKADQLSSMINGLDNKVLDNLTKSRTVRGKDGKSLRIGPQISENSRDNYLNLEEKSLQAISLHSDVKKLKSIADRSKLDEFELTKKQGELEKLGLEMDSLKDSIPEREYELIRDIRNKQASHATNGTIADISLAIEEVLSELAVSKAEVHSVNRKVKEAVDKRDDALSDLKEKDRVYDGKKAFKRVYDEEISKMKPGEVITQERLDEIRAKAQEVFDRAVDKS